MTLDCRWTMTNVRTTLRGGIAVGKPFLSFARRTAGFSSSLEKLRHIGSGRGGAPYALFPLLRCRHSSGRRVAAVVDAKSRRPPTSRRPVSRTYAGTSVLELRGRSMGDALGAFRLYRSLCCRHARCSEPKIARASHAVQRGKLLHVPSASSPLSLDAGCLVSEYRERAGFLSVVRMSADYRDRGMALPESLHRIFAMA